MYLHQVRLHLINIPAIPALVSILCYQPLQALAAESSTCWIDTLPHRQQSTTPFAEYRMQWFM